MYLTFPTLLFFIALQIRSDQGYGSECRTPLAAAAFRLGHRVKDSGNQYNRG